MFLVLSSTPSRKTIHKIEFVLSLSVTTYLYENREISNQDNDIRYRDILILSLGLRRLIYRIERTCGEALRVAVDTHGADFGL